MVDETDWGPDVATQVLIRSCCCMAAALTTADIIPTLTGSSIPSNGGSPAATFVQCFVQTCSAVVLLIEKMESADYKAQVMAQLQQLIATCSEVESYAPMPSRQAAVESELGDDTPAVAKSVRIGSVVEAAVTTRLLLICEVECQRRLRLSDDQQPYAEDNSHDDSQATDQYYEGHGTVIYSFALILALMCQGTIIYRSCWKALELSPRYWRRDTCLHWRSSNI